MKSGAIYRMGTLSMTVIDLWTSFQEL